MFKPVFRTKWRFHTACLCLIFHRAIKPALGVLEQSLHLFICPQSHQTHIWMSVRWMNQSHNNNVAITWLHNWLRGFLSVPTSLLESISYAHRSADGSPLVLVICLCYHCLALNPPPAWSPWFPSIQTESRPTSSSVYDLFFSHHLVTFLVILCWHKNTGSREDMIQHKTQNMYTSLFVWVEHESVTNVDGMPFQGCITAQGFLLKAYQQLQGWMYTCCLPG